MKAERGASGISVTGPYVEPVVLEGYMFRQEQPKKWVADKPFEYRSGSGTVLQITGTRVTGFPQQGGVGR